MKPCESASGWYLVSLAYPVADPWQWWMATIIGAGVLRVFGTYTYMPRFVGPELKPLTFVMLWP